MNRFFTLMTAIALVLPTPLLAQTNLPGTVISTGDGDTLRVLVNGKPTTVRLACVDAPESTQTGGKESAVRLGQLLPKNQNVELRAVEKDRYGRTVAEIFKSGQSINLQMVQEGRAVVYRQYLTACASTQGRYLQAEAKAKQRKLAFWSQANPVMPWDFRAGKRAPSSPAPTALDCRDIPQKRFSVLAPDPHGFDKDGDKIGCES